MMIVFIFKLFSGFCSLAAGLFVSTTVGKLLANPDYNVPTVVLGIVLSLFFAVSSAVMFYDAGATK